MLFRLLSTAALSLLIVITGVLMGVWTIMFFFFFIIILRVLFPVPASACCSIAPRARFGTRSRSRTSPAVDVLLCQSAAAAT